MKNQRDQLLDILASGMPFKCEITLNFDIGSERIEADSVPEDVHRETRRMLEEARDKIDHLTGQALHDEEQREIRRNPPPAPTEVKPPTADKPPVKKGRDAQLKDDQVWAVRRFLKKGWGNTRIANQVGCTPNVVWRIKAGKSYAKVKDEPHKSVTNIHAGHGVEKQK